MRTHQMPAGAALTPAGPADRLRGLLRALADSWDCTAAEQHFLRDHWTAEGGHDLANIAQGRARTLSHCAAELRALLEKP